MEVSHVRNRLRSAIEAARARGQERRQRNTEAERAFGVFLEMAAPLFRQTANALKVEAGLAFSVFTPERSLRLASDRSAEDFIEVTLDTGGNNPQVIGRISRGRGSRTIDAERPVKEGASPDAIGEEDLLAFLVDALQPWLERH